MDVYLREIEDICPDHRLLFRKRRERKIDALLEQQYQAPTTNTTTHQFYPCLTNLSDTHFNVSETKLLEKGLKFAVPPYQRSRRYGYFDS